QPTTEWMVTKSVPVRLSHSWVISLAMPAFGVSPERLFGYWRSGPPGRVVGRKSSVSGTRDKSPLPSSGYRGSGPSSCSLRLLKGWAVLIGVPAAAPMDRLCPVPITPTQSASGWAGSQALRVLLVLSVLLQSWWLSCL